MVPHGGTYDPSSVSSWVDCLRRRVVAPLLFGTDLAPHDLVFLNAPVKALATLYVDADNEARRLHRLLNADAGSVQVIVLCGVRFRLRPDCVQALCCGVI